MVGSIIGCIDGRLVVNEKVVTGCLTGGMIIRWCNQRILLTDLAGKVFN
jgi:hypothetical protein